MPEVIFEHEHVNHGVPLVVDTGMDEIGWAYTINIAKFSTYGGEVIQILSCYIDTMNITGTIRTYEEAENIYEFFMEYFSIATQGPNPNAIGISESRFNQIPMSMIYPERNWAFDIQPISAPGFIYSLEMVAPKWKLQAHVVDEGINTNSLKQLAISESKNELEKLEQGDVSKLETFNISGEISPSSGDPANNPFIAPLVPGTKKNSSGEVVFEPLKAKEITENVTQIGDYYLSLLPSYLKGQFADIANTAGSKPIFGRSGFEQTATSEAPEESLFGVPPGEHVETKKS